MKQSTLRFKRDYFSTFILLLLFIQVNGQVYSPCNNFSNDTLVMNANHPNTDICLPIPLNDISNYTILADGQSYTNSILGCDFDTSANYHMGIVLGTGPWNVNWWINGITFSTSVSSFSELADSMNIWNPNGNWIYEATNQIIKGNRGYDNMSSFGGLSFVDISTNSPSLTQVNYSFSAEGTQITIPSLTTELVVTDTTMNSCADTIICSFASCDYLPDTLPVQVCADIKSYYCIPVRFNYPVSEFEFYVDGNPYTDIVNGCDYDTVFVYFVAHITTLGTGPYIVNWMVNGVNYQATIQDLNDLVNQMNIWDTNGDWKLGNYNATPSTIEGGDYFTSYGDIHISSANNSALSMAVGFNNQLVAEGISISVPIGSHQLTIVDTLNNCSETTILSQNTTGLTCYQQPTANDDYFSIPVNATYSDTIWTNDIIPVDSISSYNTQLYFTPKNGILSNHANIAQSGVFTYTPNIDFVGVDSFQYWIGHDSAMYIFDIATVYLYVGISPINSLNVIDPSGCNTSDGSITIQASGNLEYSIDNGQTWQNNNIFNNLPVDAYYLATRTTNGNVSYYHQNPVLLEASNSPIVVASNDTACLNASGWISLDASKIAVNGTPLVPILALEYSSSDFITTPGYFSSGASVRISDYRARDVKMAVKHDAGFGCFGVDTFTYTLIDTAIIHYRDTFICPNDSITFYATGGASYDWYVHSGDTSSISNPTSSIVTLSPSVTTRYMANVYNQDSCLSTAQFVVAVTNFCTNRKPIAIDDINSGFNNELITGNVSSNDFDSDFDSLNYSPYTLPSHGILVFNTNGSYSYQPNLNYVGKDEFSYVVCDNGTPIRCDTAKVTIQVIDYPTSSNNAPIAHADNHHVEMSTSVFINVTGNVLHNDFDLNADNLIINPNLIQTPTNGTLVINSNGSFTYFPNFYFSGIDSAIYEVCDNNSNPLCSQAVITFKVIDSSIHPSYNKPLAVDDAFIMTENSVLQNDVLVNDGNLGSVPTVQLIQPSANGTVNLNNDGTFNYIPFQGFSGSDHFIYQICHNSNPSDCDTATVYINILSTLSALSLDQVFVADATCGLANGSITILASGGITPYEYSIDGGINWQATNIFPNLLPGVYNITIRDVNGTIVNHPTPTIIADIAAPTLVSTSYQSDTLTIQATTTNLLGLEYSIDCGTSWQLSNIFYPISSNINCIGVRNIGGSCPITQNITITNTPPVAVNDTIYARADTSSQSFPYYQIDLPYNLLDNDSDLENNQIQLTANPDTLFGPGLLHYALLDSSGVITFYPTHIWNDGVTTLTYSYEVCEIFNPTNCDTADYTLIIAPPSADSINTIRKTTALSTSDSICLPTDELLGNPTTLNVLVSPIASNIINSVSNNHCLEYYGGFLTNTADTFIVELCDEYGFCDTILFELTVIDGVWPGDTDDDTFVDNFDLLNIGLGYGWIGNIRDSITNNWNGYISSKWNVTTPSSNVDYRHIDCNGDGMINSDDTLAIHLNYGKNYIKNGGSGVINGIPLRVEVDTNYTLPKFKMPITLGNSINPATNIYGGAFSIPYDTSIVKSESVHITFDTSWIGTKDLDMITLSRNNSDNQVIDAALTRIDGMNVNGFGIIGHLNFTIRDDILQRPGGFNTDSVLLSFDFIDVKFISNDETEVPIDIVPSELTITSSTRNLLGQYIDVFPNPTNGLLNIQSNDLQIEQFQIYDMTGRNVFSEVVTSKNDHQLQLNHFISGIYTLQIHTNKGIAIKRIAIIR